MIEKRKIYFWNMAGSLVYSCSSVLLLMFVTRLTNSAEADMFSIAYSIGQLLATIGLFQVRNYQATDILEKYTFQEYFMFRIITNIAMIISIACYCYSKGYTGEKLAVVWILCLYKGVETFSDVFQGMFQQKERLDLAGKAIVFRITISTVMFLGTLAISHKILIASIVLLLTSILCIYFADWRWAKKFIKLQIKPSDWVEKKNVFVKLFLICLPLFINGFLISYTYNAPKSAIDSAIMDGHLAQGSQRDYNILFMPSSVLNLFMIFFRPMITKLAIYWAKKEYHLFYKNIRMILGCLTGVLCIILLGGYLLGIPVLSLLYGTNLGEYKKELLLLLLAGGLNSLATVMDNIVTVIRKQHLMVISYMVTAIITVIGAKTFVYHNGLIGAAMIFTIAMFGLLIGNVIIFVTGIHTEKKR